MSIDRKQRWNQHYQSADKNQRIILNPAKVVEDFCHLLPKQGCALDVACGLGGNALFLSERSLDTHAWDYSDKAIQRLEEYANNMGVTIGAQVRDLVDRPPLPASFDVIVVSNFLDRNLFPQLKNALKNNGLLYYQTFIRENVSNDGPNNLQFRLEANELLHLISGLHILVYREEGAVGNPSLGFRNQAYCVAQRRECGS